MKTHAMKRVYLVLGGLVGCEVVFVFLFISGKVSQRVLVYYFALVVIVAVVLLTVAFNEGKMELREEAARPLDAASARKTLRSIRSLKVMIAILMIGLCFGLWSSRGDQLWPRAVGVAINLFLTWACFHALRFHKKRLRQ